MHPFFSPPIRINVDNIAIVCYDNITMTIALSITSTGRKENGRASGN